MSTKTRLRLMLDAGEVRRFHANRVIKERTVGQHTYNMMVLADNYFKGQPPPNLMKAILYHDAHEAIIGDIPWPTKQAVPAIRDLEDKIDAAYDLTAPSHPNEVLLKRIDMLEFLVYLLDEKAMGNTNNVEEQQRALQELTAFGMPQPWYDFVEEVINGYH